MKTDIATREDKMAIEYIDRVDCAVLGDFYCANGERKDGADAKGRHDPGAVYDAAERVPRLRCQR